MMSYEDALKAWGAQKLEASANYRRRNKVTVELASVNVSMEFDEGYACSCGGNDPLCYCSYAESPSADVVITGRTTAGDGVKYTIDASDFDFVEILGEIVEAAGGVVASEVIVTRDHNFNEE